MWHLILKRTGCQDVIGSIPSVFLDKNNLLKNLVANLEYKFFKNLIKNKVFYI